MIEIQTAGKKTAGHKGIHGPDPKNNALILYAYTLKNPHGKVPYKICRQAVEETKAFLKENCNSKLQKMVERGVNAVKSGRPVVVVCAYGKHRSRAVAEMIGDHFHCSRIYYNHREPPYITPAKLIL